MIHCRSSALVENLSGFSFQRHIWKKRTGNSELLQGYLSARPMNTKLGNHLMPQRLETIATQTWVYRLVMGSDPISYDLACITSVIHFIVNKASIGRYSLPILFSSASSMEMAKNLEWIPGKMQGTWWIRAYVRNLLNKCWGLLMPIDSFST